MNKFAILDSFVAQYAHLPEQGTDEWKLLRKNFIGGSEVSTILKRNKNKSVNKLILEKLGFDRFQGNLITHWGNVFEELIRLRCEQMFKCSIRETGSIPYEHGYLSYSPDGLAVVPTHTIIEQFGSIDNRADHSAQLVLFEFKCPHSRVASTEIPEHYLPQVSIGMNIIDIMEMAIFVQATYRRCAFNQLKYNTHHNPYGHFKSADISSHPIECGYMIIYVDQSTDYTEDLVSSLIEMGEASEIHLDDQVILDLGSITDSIVLEEIFGNCVKKEFNVDYAFRHNYDPAIFESDAYKMDLYNQSLQYQAHQKLKLHTCQQSCIIGILPYKLLNIHLTPVAKNSNYIEDTDAHTKAQIVLQCIDDHRHMDNKSEASKSIRKYKL